MTAEVRLGAWQDVIPGTYDAARAVVITDPPFGLELIDEELGGKGFDDRIAWADHVRAVLELPAVRHVIRGPAPAIVARDYPAPRRLCVEVATGYRALPIRRPGVVPHLWCGWVVYGRLLTGRHARPPRGDAVVIRPYTDDGLRATPANGRAHRGLTPYASAEWAVDTWADPGALIVDPYAGTGTIGRAAIALGFDYLGAEIDPQWHADAVASTRYSAPSLGLVT